MLLRNFNQETLSQFKSLFFFGLTQLSLILKAALPLFNDYFFYLIVVKKLSSKKSAPHIDAEHSIVK